MEIFFYHRIWPRLLYIFISERNAQNQQSRHVLVKYHYKMPSPIIQSLEILIGFVFCESIEKKKSLRTDRSERSGKILRKQDVYERNPPPPQKKTIVEKKCSIPLITALHLV